MAFSMKVTPEIEELTNICLDHSKMDVSLYGKYDVKRGLRDVNGVGVLAGLTQISNVVSSDMIDGVKTPCDGRLYYRGINVEKLTQGFLNENRMGFEEVAYLLLFGSLPNEEQLNHFKTILKQQQSLPKNFVRDVVMKAPTRDMMNTYNHYIKGKSLYIHNPSKKLSTAENILLMLRPDQKYTPLEAKILDLALVLHMEHGGGNNSTFTTHVVSSSGTDTYSAIAAALGSLKGPKHGGANIKVVRMFDDMKSHVKDWTDEEEVSNYLRKLLHKEAFDQKGLIYGMGHAVYSISDPRARIFKTFVEQLAKEKHREKDYRLYAMVEELAPKIIGEERHIYKGVSANVDFYSGFVYSMLDLPLELYTPMFACARIVGWSAHRMEELINTDKIIRPAYKSVKDEVDYIPLENR